MRNEEVFDMINISFHRPLLCDINEEALDILFVEADVLLYYASGSVQTTSSSGVAVHPCCGSG